MSEVARQALARDLSRRQQLASHDRSTTSAPRPSYAAFVSGKLSLERGHTPYDEQPKIRAALAAWVYSESWRPWRDGTYEFSNRGEIRRVVATRTTAAGHILRQHVDKTTGYRIVGLRDKHGIRKTYCVHVVMAEVWIGSRPRGLVVNHKDGARTNNWSYNLEYITHAANVLHGINLAQSRDPSRFGYNLTADDVAEIRRRRAGGALVTHLAARYGVHRTTISAVVLRHTWRHVA